MHNDEVFERPPSQYRIPNLGYAKVGEPSTDQEWEVLEFELRNFVCEGEYKRGLERILSTFVSNLDQPKQPAAWVSGFYGSGKSHLVKVLEALWNDTKLPSGVTARGLVHLPDDVKASLLELDTAGKRKGGLWAAAGRLGSSASSIRLALLSIIFRASGLPEDYAPASFVLWLIKQDQREHVEAALERRGTTLAAELPFMVISDELAESLLEVIPTFAGSVTDAKTRLAETFPTRDDISNERLFATLDQVLGLHSRSEGKLPLTLIVVDELQQFLGNDPEKADETLAVVEDISSHLESRVLFVATGQSEMSATPELQKMRDRFTVPVTLGVSDVETVVRRVVLRKKPTAISTLESTLETISGEIRRQLAGTSIAPRDSDRTDLVADYPLLPARRRFWDVVLRGLGNLGRAGQLRTQLRVVHEAVKQVAGRDLGCVVAADAIYDQLQGDLLGTGLLLRDIASTIDELGREGTDGQLASRICKMIFLIGVAQDGRPLGIRSDATTIADLLAEDLRAGSAQFRAKVPAVLDGLVKRGILLPLADGEFRLQTRESAEWQQAYLNNLVARKADLARLRDDRVDALKKAVEAARSGVRIGQGASNESRKLTLQLGESPPPGQIAAAGEIPVWIRDEWSVSVNQVEHDARSAGADASTIFTFLPKRNADALMERIAEIQAREETLQRPAPTTDAGKEARNSMEAQLRRAREARDEYVAAVLADAQVFLGGGTEPGGKALQEKLTEAAKAAAIRLFPSFSAGDHAKWGEVLPAIKQGSGDPLARVGHQGPPEAHPVCKEILSFIGNGAPKGSAIRAHFQAPPYGWPRDAIDGALMALTASGQIVAKRDGVQVEAKSFDAHTIGGATFEKEGDIVTAAERIALRGLVKDLLDVPVKAGDELDGVLRLLNEMKSLALEAGDEAPAPPRPQTDEVERLRQYAGNRLLRETLNGSETLRAQFADWSNRKQLLSARKPGWTQVKALQDHARDLPVAAEVAADIDAILHERRLLDEPDPTFPLREKLATALRAAVQRAHADLETAKTNAVRTLEATVDWNSLDASQRASILRDHQLEVGGSPSLGTNAELQSALDRVPLADWADKLAAVSGRLDEARRQAAKLLEPKSIAVAIPKRTIRTSADLESFLEEVRLLIEPHLGQGPVII